ncbi:MAG: hypothetical protein HFI16_15045 [Lachnospiraceae bacterium]|nr:hypothetical protein [Lachnospiraceae bacterium]
MQNALFQAICRMGIFMICIRAIIHFRPNETYEKYLRLLAGIMVMIQLFMPVGRFILGKGGQEAAEILEQFRKELELGMEEAMESAEAADALLEQMTLEEVQDRLEEPQDGADALGGGEGGEVEYAPEAGAAQGGENTRQGSTGREGQTTWEGGAGQRGEAAPEGRSAQGSGAAWESSEDQDRGAAWEGSAAQGTEAAWESSESQDRGSAQGTGGADIGKSGIIIQVEKITPVVIDPVR